MKCPHCNQEHPDGTLYCPMTGSKMPAEGMISCINKDCPNYGKMNLPQSARFCPLCGKPTTNKKVMYDLVLVSFGSNKLSTVKALKEVCDFGLAEAIDIADNAPSLIISGVSEKKANKIKRKIEEAGGNVEITEEGNADSVINEYNDIDLEEYDDENDDIYTPCCPKCGSDDLDYDKHWPDCTCNDCGYVFDESPQCPECESEDVSDDGSGHIQYTCNNCGHVWGDEGVYDNEGNIATQYLEVYNVILGSTTREEIIGMGGKRDYESNGESYKMESGIDVSISDTSKYVQSISWWFSSKQRNFPPSYEELGITWDISKDDLIERLRNLGFYVSLNHPVDIYSTIKVSKWNELTIYWDYLGTGNLQHVGFFYHYD